MQDVFARAWRSRSSFEAGKHVRPWLFTIARNCVTSALLRNRRRSRIRGEEGVDEIAGRRDEVVARVAGREQLQLLRSELRELPSNFRQIIELGYFHGLTYAEIESRLGICQATLRSRMFHAVRQLASQLS